MTRRPLFPDTDISRRERQVARMLGRGRTVSQIADNLDLSVKTVSTYRRRLLDKLRIRTTAALMHAVITHELQRRRRRR